MVDEFKLGRKAPVLLPDASGGAGRTEPSAWLSLGGLTRQCQAGLSGLAPADAPSRSWIFSGSSVRVFLALGWRAGAPRPPRPLAEQGPRAAASASAALSASVQGWSCLPGSVSLLKT